MIITSTGSVRLLSARNFRDAVVRHFGDHCVIVDDRGIPEVDVTVHVSRAGEPEFTVDHDRDAMTVRVDGTALQDAAVAAWVRSLLSEEFPRVIGFDESWDWHVELVHGITPDRVLSERVSHDDPNWATGDPDLS